MAHSHAVVGINTSALIESGITGRLVYSVRAEEFSGTQEGTLHFQHLKRGGLLRLADTLPEHTDQLARSFASADRDRAEIRAFVESFVRPRGLERAATPLVVDAIEEAPALGVKPRPLPSGTRVLQLALMVLFYPFDYLVFLLRRDREHWYGVWRHATRPFRLAGRRGRGAAIRGTRRLMRFPSVAAKGVRTVGRALWVVVYRAQKMARHRAPRVARRAVRLGLLPLRVVARGLARGRAILGSRLGSHPDQPL
jgi:hypothetical protein